MERTEDRSKALSYIGIEIAEALKGIPKPADVVFEEATEEVEEPVAEKIVEEVKTVEPEVKKAKKVEKKAKENVQEIKEEVELEKEKVKSQIVAAVDATEESSEEQQIQEYQESVTVQKKPSLWQRFKNSKLAKAVSYVFKIRIRIELPNALPEGRGENE